MGRPIKQTFIGNTAATGQQIAATVWLPFDTQARTDGYFIQQKATSTYQAASVSNPGGVQPGLVTLVNGVPTGPAQANVSVIGYNSMVVEQAQVIFDHTVVTFLGNTYTWYPTGTTLTQPGTAIIRTA